MSRYAFLDDGTIVAACRRNGRDELLGYDVPFTALFGYRLAVFGLSYFTPGPHVGGDEVFLDLLEEIPLDDLLSEDHLVEGLDEAPAGLAEPFLQPLEETVLLFFLSRHLNTLRAGMVLRHKTKGLLDTGAGHTFDEFVFYRDCGLGVNVNLESYVRRVTETSEDIPFFSMETP